MKFPIILLPIVFSFLVSAQPIIKFDIEGYDYGRIQRGSNGDRKFEFTNTGDSALVVYHARTGDGGSMAEFSRNPILPNEKGIITFRYDTQRIDVFFSRTLVVQSNAEPFRMHIKGIVVFPSTKIVLSDSIFNLGDINYGERKELKLSLNIVGQQKLYLNSPGYYTPFPEMDVQLVRIEPLKPDCDTISVEKDIYEPNEVLHLTFEVRNIIGNLGDFERRIPLQINTDEVQRITIRGKYIGSPEKTIVTETIHNANDIFQYESGNLQRRTRCFSSDEKRIFFKQYFTNGSTTKIEYFNSSQ